MTTANKIILAVMALGLVVAGIVFVPRDSGSNAPKVGTTNQVGDLRQLVTWFTNIVYLGSDQQLSIDASGNVTTSGTITTTGGVVTTGTTQTVNGVTDTFYRSSSMNQASTTNCSFSVTATSTLESFAATITAGTTTASTLTLATSTSPSASTSPIATRTVAAGAQATFDWHPGNQNSQVFPGTYVNLTQAGGIGTFSNTGSCNMNTRSAN